MASSHIRLLGVDISFDLSLDHHVSHICTGCYYRLRQLGRLRRSLDSDSLAAFVYAVVKSQIVYCNTVLAGAPRTVTDKLQRLLNAAATVVTGTRLRSANRQRLAVPHYNGSTLTAVGPFQLPAPQSGTLSQISSGTRPSVQTVRRLLRTYLCIRY